MRKREAGLALAGFAVTVALAAAAGADVAVTTPPEKAAASAPQLVQIPTHRGERPFFVDRADLASSAASLDRSAQGQEAEAGYELHARVVVRSADAGAVSALTAELTGNAAKVTPAGAPESPLAGFWLIECATVAQAADVARALQKSPQVQEAYVDLREPLTLRSTLPTDPGFTQQWYLHNTTVPANDANLAGAWKSGFTGAGVTVGVVEGWYTLHPDLAAKYNAEASQPGEAWGSHGTSVAGVIGMIANNDIGGAGAAHGASLSKLYFGASSVNAAAFGFRNDLNAVKNNSWGPADNGIARVLASIEQAAIEDAVLNGRGGLGTIFVWACGNGGAGVDRVDYDPYASNRYTIAVGAIDSQDRRSVYSEPGASLLVVAQSDYDIGSSGDPGIYTTTSTNGYTNNFGGTSSSSPLAAGVVAIVLEANPQLSWRDVQQVLARSARQCRPFDASWRVNGAGLHVSEQFGFGAVDAGAAAALAQEWTPLPPEFMHDTGVVTEGIAIPDNNPASLVRTVNVPVHMRIESVELVLDADHNSCGQLRVAIRNPQGLESLFANTRTDPSNTYNNGYVFTSVKYLGERAAGTWELRIADGAAGTTGTLDSWRLRFYGTEIACPCDWEDDGDIDVPDIFAYLSAWFAGSADFDLDGVTGVPDIFAFLGCWFSGPCP